MLIENKGIQTSTFYIPPFTLNVGEIVVVYLYNGAHYYETEMFLKNIFCGKTQNGNVIVNKTLTFVPYFFEPKLRQLFYPVTVGEYLKKNADLSSPYASKIYETEWITKKTKVNTLAGNPRKQLSLYSVLSRTNTIVFDLAGQDPKGAEATYEVVKDSVKNGGSAILLDCFDDMKNDCTKFIELKWKKE